MSKFNFIPEIGALVNGRQVVYLTSAKIVEHSGSRTVSDIGILIANREKFQKNNPEINVVNFSLPTAEISRSSIIFKGISFEEQELTTIAHMKAIVEDYERKNGEVKIEFKEPEPLPVV